MRLLLRSDVQGLGKKGELVEVTDGYARNFLMPRGLAMKASKGVEAQAATMRRARDVRDAADRSAAEEVAKVLVPQVIHIRAKAGAEGRLFGSVTSADVVDAVQSQTGVELDRRMLHSDQPIKTVGTHTVQAKLHTDVEFAITIEVAEL